MSRQLAGLICLLMIATALLLASPALGQGDEDAAPSGAGQMKWFDFFVLKGGWITFLLIVLSVVAIALTIEHSTSIRRKTIAPPEFARQIQSLIDEKKYLDAVQSAAREPSMMGHVLNAGLMESANGYGAMERAVQEALEDRAARLFRKIEYLNVIGNVSPMIGLFGTVYGMIKLFARIHEEGAMPPAPVVADNIAIALITTFWGLGVAIPALSVFAVFRNRIDVLTAECAIVTERLLSVFKPGAPAAQAAAQRSRQAPGPAAEPAMPIAPPASAEPPSTPQT